MPLPAGSTCGCAWPFPGQPRFAEAILHRIERYFHFVADPDLQFALVVEELIGRDDGLGLQTGVDDDHILVHVNDRCLQDRALLHLPAGETLLQQFGKGFTHACTSAFAGLQFYAAPS